jgi:hypothetical protein
VFLLLRATLIKGKVAMTEQLTYPDAGKTPEQQNESESSLEDLQPTTDVTAGFNPKATDVTLKRGVIG